MKNKKVLIGIVCGVILVALVAVIALLLGTTKPKEEVVKPKTDKKLNTVRTFEGFEFKNAKVEDKEGAYTLSVEITNKTAKEKATRVIVKYYGTDEKELGAAVCMIPKIEKEKSIELFCSCDIKEILNAVDYKVIATEKEIHDLKQS